MEKQRARMYGKISYTALGLIVTGFILQGVATWVTH